MVFCHHRLSFKPENFDLTTTFNIPKQSVEDMLRKGCDFLGAPNSITKVASMDKYGRSVPSDDVVSLLIIKPRFK